MIRRLFLNTLAAAVLILGGISFPTAASAGTLAENLIYTHTPFEVPAQSVTTPAGGPFDHITFNFMWDNKPAAAGSLFVFDRPYEGTYADINSNAPGCVAQSTGIVNGVYQFDPSVTLQPSTKYYFYSNAQLLLQLGGDNYAAGEVGIYNPLAYGDYYTFISTHDWCFQLSGSVVNHDADGDGIADDEDAVLNSDLRSHVDTGAGATTVPNTVDETGTSLQDVINALFANARNRGQYVSAITQLADGLRKAGLITQKQAAELKAGGAKAR